MVGLTDTRLVQHFQAAGATASVSVVPIPQFTALMGGSLDSLAHKMLKLSANFDALVDACEAKGMDIAGHPEPSIHVMTSARLELAKAPKGRAFSMYDV